MLALPADSVPFEAPIEGEQRSVGSKAEVTNRDVSIGRETSCLKYIPILEGRNHRLTRRQASHRMSQIDILRIATRPTSDRQQARMLKLQSFLVA